MSIGPASQYGLIIPKASYITSLVRQGTISKDAAKRLRWMDHYRRHRNARLTCRYFGISPQTFYRWKDRFDPYDLSTLEERSRRPHRVRQSQTPVRVVERIQKLREQYPRWGKDVDLDWLMKTKMHFWTWRTEEVKQLFKWMKSYNSTRNDNEKIHYYGFDCQFTTYQSEFIQEYLDRTLPSLWDSIASILNQVKEFSDSNYDTMDEDTYLDIKTKLESFEDQFEENKNTLIANSSSTEYEINKQLLITFKQAFICKVGKYSSQTRDMFMAENALWISNFLGKNAKITLWAHNYHISTFYAWMGYYVGANLGNMYKAVGFSFSQGSFTAFGPDRGPLGIYEITTEPTSSSVNFIFHHASHPNFAFHIEAITPGSEWDKWLGSQRPFLMIGALFSGEVLQYYKPFNIKAFDWIIHFDQTTASSLIPMN